MNIRLKPLAAALPALLPLLFATDVHAATQLDPVVITATRQNSRIAEVLADTSILDAASIQRAGAITSLGELLGRQPGIEFRQSGGPGTTSSLFMRGTNSDHVLLLVDGMRVGSVTAGGAAWENLPLEQIERIEIVRGSASALYGSDAIGGVIQVFTKRGSGRAQPWFEIGYGSHQTTHLAAGISGSQSAIQGWNYNLQAANTRSDSFSAIQDPANLSWNPDRDGYRRTAASGSLGYKFNAQHEVGANFLYSDGWNRIDIGNLAPGSLASDDYRMDEKLSSLRVYSRNQLAANWVSTLQIGRSLDDSRNLDNGVQTSQYKSTQTQYQWQNDLTLPVGTALLAVERLEQRVTSSDNYALGKRSIDSLLAGWTAQLNQHHLQLNARQDHNSQFGNKTTGGLAYGYQFTSAWRTSFSWGTAFKAPTFNDLYYPADGWGNVSNPNLRPETSENRELALRHETSHQESSIVYYDNEIKDLIQWAPIDPSYVTSFGWTPTNLNKARIKGWTLSHAGRNEQGYRWSASADLLDPRDRATDKVLIQRARKTAKLSLGRDFGQFAVDAELQATGRRYIDAGNSQRLAGHALLNLSASHQLTPEWRLTARANNLLNRDYTLVNGFATDGANFFISLRYTPR